ncbi:TPA: hypothetical protein NID02_001624 [Pseudomonas aeruginosa]|nr:hypothetical protein [Pseudomonas aeruginosa]
MKYIFSLITFVLLLFTASVNAQPLSQTLSEGLGGSIKLQQSQTEDQKSLDPVYALSEALYGCSLSQQMKIWPAFDSGVIEECYGKNNIFNSGAANIFSAAVAGVAGLFVAILGAVGGWLSLTRLIDVVSGRASRQQTFTFTLLILFIVLLLKPVIRTAPETENEGWNQNKISALTFILSPLFVATLHAIESYLTETNEKAVMLYPPIKIPVYANGKDQDIYNMIDFFVCAAGYPDDEKSQIDFFSVDDEVKGYKQIDKCSISISFKINQQLIDEAKAQGFIDFKQYAINNVKQAITAAATDANAVARNIASKPQPLAGKELDPFDATKLVDGDEGSYNLNAMSAAGIGEYAWAASQNISKRLAESLNHYPNLDEQSLPASRSPQLCVNTPGGTSFFKNADADENLKACVQSMCADGSSQYVCGAAVAYAAQYLDQSFYEHPNFFTMFKNFMARFYGSDAFIEKAHLTYNSLSIDSTISEGLYEPLRIGNVAFTVPYQHFENAINHDWWFENGFDLFGSTLINTDYNQAVYDALTIGTDGFMGIVRTNFCLQNPNTNEAEGSGFYCPSVFKTMQMQGKRFLEAAAYLEAGARAAKLTRKTPVDKAAASAAVKQGVALVGEITTKMGMSKTALIALAALSEKTDEMYSEYGTTLGNEQIYALAALFVIPELADTMHHAAIYLWSAGVFLTIVIPMTVGLSVLGMFITFLVVIITALIKIIPYAVLLFKNEGVNHQSDFFVPFDDLLVFFLSMFGYAILFTFAPMFIDTLFAYRVFDLERMMTLNHQLPVFDGIVGAVKATSVYVIFFVILMVNIWAIFKVSMSSFTIIKHIAFGDKHDSSDYYEQAELRHKKDVI